MIIAQSTESYTHVTAYRIIISESHDSLYHIVCRAKLSLTRFSAAYCSRRLLDWAQCAQDKQSMEPVPGGCARPHGWQEGRGIRAAWVISHVTSLESLEFSSDRQGHVTHVTCSALRTIYEQDSKIS